MGERTRRRRRSASSRVGARKRLIIIAAIVVVAAISAVLAIQASDGTAKQPSTELPVEGGPDG